MGKKNKKRPRKRKRLTADPKRQANDSLRGYRYQILHSVNAWLNLADDEILRLEGVEDFDIVSNNAATLVQVKDTRRNVTLKSKAVIEAINHYWESRAEHPDLTVKFRFITRSKIGKEQGNPFGRDQLGLRLWKRCSGDEEIIKKISELLQNQETISDEVKDFLKQAEFQQIYEQLIESITWETDSKDASSLERSISDKVLSVGKQYSIPIPSHDTKKVVDSLLAKVFTVATQQENRVLTQMHFLKIFEGLVSEKYSQRLKMLAEQAAVLDNANIAFMGGKSDVTIQSLSSIQTAIPPLYPDAFRRTDLLTNIQAKLQSDGIVVIQGGVDKGKTTLAKLTANNIDSDWFWLKFTDKEASQVVQDLQQLDIAISNRSSQVNVVFDDLNLQPQELQGYEEDLGVVVYRVLERGAKLLITSQHEPPNNFIRSLGLSSPVVIHVPNFTISEIEQFAQQLGCPAEKAKTWAKLFQFPTKRHPRLVHALLTQLRKAGWKRQDVIESILQTPPELVKELKEAQQLLTNLPTDQQEFLYRLSLVCTEFRKDYALNISEIPEIISYPGRVFDQLVDPWMDRLDKTYYILSPLLDNAAEQVWPESKINRFHVEVANAILKAKNLTTIEARAILLHSMRGQNREGLIAVIGSLMTAPEDKWQILKQEFSWLTRTKIDPYEEFFPGDALVNYSFRALQYRIAVEVEPEFAPKILEVWDKETKPYESHQLYLQSRLMLATQVLRYNQVSLPAKKMVGYLKEIIDIRENHKDVWETYRDSMAQLEEHKTGKSSIFSILFSFVYTRIPIYAPFLGDLIDILNELDPEDRTLLLTDFEDDNVEPRLLIDGVWLAEANLENPDWARCLEVFDKVIERAIAWGYPHIAAASTRGKAIIYDEKLNDPDTAHKVLQDIALEVRRLPVIEEERAMVYFRYEHYREALNIYERILPQWNPPSEQLNIGPLEEYRRAAICAASLNDWKKAAVFFLEGAKRTQEIEKTERYIGLYADAGFAHFKAGNMLDSIKLLSLALQKFEMLPQDKTNVRYFTLKERLVYTTRQVVALSRNYALEIEELPVGFCSNPDTDEKVLDLPDSPIGETWVNLAQIEYKFSDKTTAFQNALQITDRNSYPILDVSLSLLETRYDFRNKTFDNLPQRISQLTNVCDSIKEYNRSGKGMGKNELASIPIAAIPDFTSVENITVMLVGSLLVQLPTGVNIHENLAIWRTNSSELPIKEDIFTVLDLIESTLLGDQNHTLTVLKTQDVESEKRLVAALKIMQSKETSPGDLLYAHTFITTSLIDQIWLDPVVPDLAKLLSVQWQEKIGEIPIKAMSQLEDACNSSEVGKKKIGQILLAALQAVSPGAPSEIFQKFHSWIE